jgi:predicted dehydrogenase
MRPYGWLFERALGGGWIGAWGSHAIDALRWLVGEVEVLRSEPRTTIGSRPDRDGRMRACDAEDGFSALLRLGAGASAVIDSTFAAPAPITPRLVIAGTDAVAECVADRRVVVRHAEGTTDEFVPQDAADDPHLAPMQRWTSIVRDAVRDGVAAPGAPTFADGLACAVVLDALR